jgi:site-specific DNA-methyltransferase (cytosine-N4-specific)
MLRVRRPDYEDDNVQLFLGDCTDILPHLKSRSIAASISYPLYPEISRDYGRLSEEAWHPLMHLVIIETRRILRDNGSAMYVLQPNSAHVGQMRMWLWDFVCWAGREWNLIQDVYWWNNTALPTVHCQRKRGLLRPSLKYCVWLGAPDCYRNQDAVLLPSEATVATSSQIKRKPSGHSTVDGRMARTVAERGGSTPFNLLKIRNNYRKDCAGSYGHGAGTPLALCDWWVRYLTEPGDTVLDPFMGAGTSGIAAVMRGRRFAGIEKEEKYFNIAVERFRRIAVARPLPDLPSRRDPPPTCFA